MSLVISLVAKNLAKLTLVETQPSTFLDSNFDFVGNRFSPHKDSDNMLEIIQKTRVSLQIQLVTSQGLPYDLTNFVTLTLGLFSRAPQTSTISLTAGSIAGIPSDGLVNFTLTETDTDFNGFGIGQIKVQMPSGVVGFESFQVVYRANFLP